MTKTHNSAEVVAANEDILMEILVRLPIKSLFRFKCVSIKWLHLICSRYFSHNHCLKNGTVSTTGLFLYQHQSLMHVSLRNGDPDSRPGFGPVQIFDFLKITPRASNLTILTSCGGLLLCLLVAPPGSDIDIVYIVCNPATKLSTALPPLENLAKKPIVNMDLAYDPRNSPHYSVVCMRNCNPPDGPEFKIQIFSSENGGWRDCAGPFYGFPPGMQFRGGVHWKKSIHYLNYWGGDSVYFDVETESMKSLPMPLRQRDTNTMKRSWYLGESGGHLHLVDVHTNIRRDSSIDIYELRGDYSGWFVRCRVNISAMEAAFPEMVQRIEAVPVLVGARRINLGRYNKYSVLSVVQEEGEGSLEIVMSVPNHIIAFNPGNNTFKVLVYFRDERDRALFEWHNLIHYSHTLAPA